MECSDCRYRRNGICTKHNVRLTLKDICGMELVFNKTAGCQKQEKEKESE